jgi:hypothetical protein
MHVTAAHERIAVTGGPEGAADGLVVVVAFDTFAVFGVKIYPKPKSKCCKKATEFWWPHSALSVSRSPAASSTGSRLHRQQTADAETETQPRKAAGCLLTPDPLFLFVGLP